MATLVIAEHDNGEIKPATLHSLTAATGLGGEIDLLIMGHDCRVVAEAARGLGIRKVLLADDASHEHQLAEPCAALVVSLAGDYSHVLAAATTQGKNLLPRVAALLDVGMVSDVIGIEAADTFRRPIYAGNAIATVQSLDPIKVLTVRATAFEAMPPGDGQAELEVLAPVAGPSGSCFVGEELATSERPELTAARVVISGGRGMGSKENFALLEQVADKLNAAVGATRAAVDAGFAANDMQVGQTGKIVAPELYIAVGLSGAIQHLAGMKDSKIIVAINKDGEAPIFEVADYGLVADLFDVLPELDKELGKELDKL
ncbi:electron transfer flavoprotein subunit alpha/FixB family protein [Oceanisphaera arctica]|uniref:Electron transfer flavoprotein subunit alpha n=1 Tax=Oceanisphaera arctica TaxID=641510 RepID=A0A2P5TM99_9GAMM|nr:FAD-binding protein [Oceanisphaera arctica]PPL16490.1 electron transfer flavoprotein subunit alpha [Oceanisphaera arctica]GHA03939.1 electron transfer flavoprotein subunit beta [Oceanisphaera arctica]